MGGTGARSGQDTGSRGVSDVGVSSSGREERSICTRPAPPCDQGTQDSLPVENSLGTTDPPREALVGTFTLAGT